MLHDLRAAGISGMFLFLSLCLAVSGTATELKQSLFDQELLKVRYDLTDRLGAGTSYLVGTEEEDLPLSAIAQAEAPPPDYKSPGRAFIYSLAVPGLGQYYYGSRIKPFLFLALEVAGWTQALKYHGQGDDLTDEFQKFNNLHWLRDNYYQYLDWVYQTWRPDTVKNADSTLAYPEARHVIPDDRNQQYYEMTGKYAQFAWGWDDAEWGDDHKKLSDFTGGADIPEAIRTDKTTPYSANRLHYEDLRDDANQEYDRAMKWVFVIMANHLVSAFEAYFVTKSHNNKLRYEQEFARIKVEPSLRSYSSWKDTPYVTLSYKF